MAQGWKELCEETFLARAPIISSDLSFLILIIAFVIIIIIIIDIIIIIVVVNIINIYEMKKVGVHVR